MYLKRQLIPCIYVHTYRLEQIGGIDWWLNVTCNLLVTVPAMSLFSIMLHVTVLVPVGYQLHGRNSHAGLPARSLVGTPILVLAYSPVGTLASMAGLPRWYFRKLVPIALTEGLPRWYSN